MHTSPQYYLFTILLLFALNIGYSQDRSKYELLWEIKHKNSDKKSYLFGTLHLKDARAFSFSDSVIPAIQRSEVFALEIHPDSAVSGFSEKFYSTEKENIYKKILSEEEYQKLKDRLFEVKQINLDSFPMKDPSLIKSMLTNTVGRSDDRRTFLDAYLYGIAYNSKKEITGLEDVADQMYIFNDQNDITLRESILSILDDTQRNTNNQINHITQLYYEGDLEKILDYVSDRATDSIMVKRNLVMRNSIENIIKTKTLFAAVGAAHLPGEQGIIAMLRQDGYEVNKVKATFNNTEAQYSITPDLDRWVLDRDESMGYSVLTPNKATPIAINETVNAMTSTDLIYGGSFMYMIGDLRNQVLKEGYDFLGNIIASQTRMPTDSIISKETFVKDDVQFTEVLIAKGSEYVRMRLAMKDKIVYTFMTENTLDEINSAYANAFFNSIKIFIPKVQPSIWKTHTDSIGAFSIRVPGKILDRSQTKDNPDGNDNSPYIINIFSAEDKANNSIYLVRYNDQPVGYYLDQKEVYFNEFDTYFKASGSYVAEPEKIMMDGNEGRKYELLFSGKHHTIAKLFLRGNRTYLLMAQSFNEEEKISADNEFFKSFTFLPYTNAAFDTIVNIQDKYLFTAPSKNVLTEDEPQDAYSEYSSVKNYSSLDPTSSGTYLVQQMKLKPYYRKKSLDAFYKDYAELLIANNDSITSNVSITLGGKPAREIFMQNTNTHVKQRMKIVLDDDTILLMLTYLGDEEINNPRVEKFFNSLKIKHSSKNFDLSASKADLIFKHLKSEDTTKFAEASGALGYYDFDASEYKYLEKHLKHNFPDDSIYYGAKYYIINAMAQLEKPETLKTFSSFYKNEQNSYEARIEILEQLPKLKNTEAMATYFNLLKKHKLNHPSNKDYDIMTSFLDTIPLLVENDAQFAELAEIDDYRAEIASMYSYYVMEDSIYKDRMPLLKNKLLRHMYEDAALYVDTIARKGNLLITDGLMYSYIEFAKGFKNIPQEVSKTLKLISEQVKDDNWLQAQALMAAIELNIEINPQIVKSVLKELYVRFELMESLVKAEKSYLIPEEYLAPLAFAKLSLYNMVGAEYDGYPEIINYLDQLTINNKKYFVFQFSYSEDDTTKYLGIVLQEPINFTDFKMAEAFTDHEIMEEDWRDQALNIIVP
ncbi:TraB/GumN family protein [Aequorivita flava]|uniref:TraB/GumN family protein n=1 Tax=Aequorivita flava TaxID=3114371 RepID=A0AB35YRN9_9FLAO